ncbi:MAG TPA: AAA family ATPase [Candidatus Saccharimonadales bacterium]|nr:AAA family ATPase [Candidatus Saccharimonadales bacterium]
MSKLILLNGAVAVGKSTITERYLNEHPLALGISGDNIIVMLGQWLQHEPEAWNMVFEFTKALTATHLKTGHDVVLPYLLVHPGHVEAFEALAQQHNAQFYEVLLYADREDAIQRALQRGTWGEPGSPPLTAADRPILEEKYDTMMQIVSARPQTIKIPATKGAVEETYAQFLAAISRP